MMQKITSFILEIFFPPSCYLCKKEGRSLCTQCLQERARSYDSPSPVITPIYSFKDPSIKRIIHAIKYFHRKDLISPLVVKISEEILRRPHNDSILVPIPMPLLRKYMRGYNHDEAIVKEISKQTSIPTQLNLLIRRKSKRRQVTMRSRAERLKNQLGAFQTSSNVQEMNIILIDDVTTTGATLLEARKILLEKGASSVECYTVAH